MSSTLETGICLEPTAVSRAPGVFAPFWLSLPARSAEPLQSKSYPRNMLCAKRRCGLQVERRILPARWYCRRALGRIPQSFAVSGPGVSPGEQMIVYYANELRRQGVLEGDVREASAVRRDIWSYMSSGNGYEKVKAELEQARTKRWFSQARAQQDDSFGTLPKPEELGTPAGRSWLWFRQEMNYDSVAALRALRVPALSCSATGIG